MKNKDKIGGISLLVKIYMAIVIKMDHIGDLDIDERNIDEENSKIFQHNIVKLSGQRCKNNSMGKEWFFQQMVIEQLDTIKTNKQTKTCLI